MCVFLTYDNWCTVIRSGLKDKRLDELYGSRKERFMDYEKKLVVEHKKRSF